MTDTILNTIFKLISKYYVIPVGPVVHIQGHTHQLCCNSKLLETDFWRICTYVKKPFVPEVKGIFEPASSSTPLGADWDKPGKWIL